MMENKQPLYDVAIIGGGLAGLASAIQLARKGYSVVLFEKETYPFHKVCGEYISMESWGFLEELGLGLTDLELPRIKRLMLTSPNGKAFTTNLGLGGFGISRYTIDCLLAGIAKQQGVALLDATKVNDASFDGSKFFVRFSSAKELNCNEVKAKLCFGSFGKRSNLDVKWRRSFVAETGNRQNNYVAVKYHIKTSWPSDLIGLHNFSDGYCGISKIEDDKYCLCYLTTAANLKKSSNSISSMEENILYKNPALKAIFNSSEFLEGFPLTISQVSFSKKKLIEKHLIMAGDAAGMITPLCGNGMSMALHASKMAAGCGNDFLSGICSRHQMEETYTDLWKKEFASRLRTGRVLQGFFGADSLSNLFVSALNTFPSLASGIIKKTHGKPF